MGTERRLPVSDAEVLAANRAGESQRALAERFKVSKGAVQKAIARAKDRSPQASPKLSASPGPTHTEGSRPMSTLDIRERLEHEALHSGDSRTRLSALKMLKDLEPEESNHAADGPSIYTLRHGTLILEPEPGTGPEPRYRLMVRVRGGIEHAANDLTARQACAFVIMMLLLSEEEVSELAGRVGGATRG